MLRAWLRRKAAVTDHPKARRPGSDREQTPHPEPPTADPILVDSDAELPPYDPDEWTFPFRDLSWTGAADEAEPAAPVRAKPGEPYFVCDDAGTPDGDAWRSAGWWLQAEPKLERRFIAAAAHAVPALLRAWTYTDAAPVGDPIPRGDARIALLREWGGRFSPEQMAELLAAA
jgi:hypothetical protein